MRRPINESIPTTIDYKNLIIVGLIPSLAQGTIINILPCCNSHALTMIPAATLSFSQQLFQDQFHCQLLFKALIFHNQTKIVEYFLGKLAAMTKKKNYN